MLGRQLIHALKALLELAGEPERWRSVRDLATSQALPEPMLEQLLLQLRRAGVLEARRGRSGGYRLARPAAAIPLSAVLAALDHDLADRVPEAKGPGAAGPKTTDPGAENPGATGLGAKSPRTKGPETRAARSSNPTGSRAETSDPAALDRVTALLEARLRDALARELARCTLAELLFDLRSARAELSEEGGLLLG
jgi:Rrf2 family iron-sulfur cluster assembly transcriptional regulator